MPSKTGDPLLIAAKVATVLVRIGLVVGMIGLGVAGALTAIGGGLAEHIAITVEPESLGQIGGAVVLVVVLTLVSLGLMYDFVTRLAQIIDTVGEGDPFTLANAARLTRMGWLAVAVQVLALPATLLAAWLESRVDEGVFQLSSDMSLTALGLALVLFILARVFRHGAAMRDDLEGTV